MNFRMVGQDRLPTGLLKQLASVQQTATQSGIASNTPAWYDGTDLNSSTAQFQLSTTWWDSETGNAFRYVRATGTLTPGQLVSLANPTAGTVTAAGSTVQVVNTNVDTTTLGNQAGNFVWFLDAAGTYSAATTPYKQSLRRIKSSTVGTNAALTLSLRGSIYGNNAFDPDALPSVPANGSDLRIIRPGHVETASATKAPVGVALAEVTLNNYTVIQVAGIALVQANNVVAATVLGTPGSVQASGVFSGTATAATGSGQILPLYAITSATTSLIPCFVNFMGA